MAGKMTEMTALSGALALTDLLEVTDDPGGTPLSRKATFTHVKTLLGGDTIQTVHTHTGAMATGSTVIPADDTIPQQSEGDEYMTLPITPTNASNRLVITVVFMGTIHTNSALLCVALFQDATANALACGAAAIVFVGHNMVITFQHEMAAGTTSATTFKVRAGGNVGTTTFNGSNGARLYGGALCSSITIEEKRA